MSTTKHLRNKTLHIVGCGENVSCCLGPNKNANLEFYDIPIPKDVTGIKKMITGLSYSAFIDQEGRLFEWGQLTLKTPVLEIPTPCQYFINRNLKIVDASCINRHVVVITDNNQVYTWGHNYKHFFPNCDRDFVDSNDPALIEFANVNCNPVAVACGGFFTMVLFENGDVYSFGFNRENCLGVEDPDIILRVPTKMDLRNIIHISSGWSHGCAINKNHILYAWGRTSFGRLGHIHGCYISDIDIGLTNTSISTSKENGSDEFLVKTACCSHTSTFALSYQGDLFSCGWNQSGENGVGHKKSTRYMRKVIFDSNPAEINPTQSRRIKNQKKGIAMISGGAGTFIVLDESGIAYASGSNKNNMIGLGKNCEESLIFSQITALKHVKYAAAGYIHSLFAVEC
ncbi:hypothetical protein M9Y10_021595 [Tritrichomonas musculus]|uniref:RCC1-like domain-containing protein n=1 Tax=Tritrichomonas musculus TaxID=1915356 RepID=A0ABR2KT80_9EUKA